MVVVLPIWVICSLLTFATAKEEKVPISQIYARIQPSSGMDEVRVEYHRDLKKKILLSLGITSALLGGLLLCLCCLWIFKVKRLKNSTGKRQQPLNVAKGGHPFVPFLGKLNSLRMGGKKGNNNNVMIFEYHLLEAATNNFEECSKIEEGGWGCLYRASMSENFNGMVKKLDGGGIEREFQNEVGWLSRIQHQNIVSLLGYCIHEESKFMVYEIMQNGSLESQLHGPSCGSALTWSLRMKIAVDVARGLEYLHEHCDPAVLHRNIKSSNVLLDSNFNAKLSGFSLAVSVGTQNKNDLKVSETSGYLAPEYLSDGKLTDKSDVYSFGVVLLELLTGRNPTEKMSPAHHQSVVSWAMPQVTDRTKLRNIVDPVMRDKMDLKHLYQVAAVAVLCVQAEPSYRPLITDVLHSLIPLVPVELGGSLRVAENPKQ